MAQDWNSTMQDIAKNVFQQQALAQAEAKVRAIYNLANVRQVVQQEATRRGVSYADFLKTLKDLWSDVPNNQRRPLLDQAVSQGLQDPDPYHQVMNDYIEALPNKATTQVQAQATAYRQQQNLQLALASTPQVILQAAPSNSEWNLFVSQTANVLLAQQQQPGTTVQPTGAKPGDAGPMPGDGSAEILRQAAEQAQKDAAAALKAQQPKIPTWGWVAIGAAGVFVLSRLLNRRER